MLLCTTQYHFDFTCMFTKFIRYLTYKLETGCPNAALIFNGVNILLNVHNEVEYGTPMVPRYAESVCWVSMLGQYLLCSVFWAASLYEHTSTSHTLRGSLWLVGHICVL